MTLSVLPLSYCTNVHPARSVDDVIDGLSRYTGPVRHLSGSPVAAGLWLNDGVTRELADSAAQMTRLQECLREQELLCYTLNTFPFGDFHEERVKENVYLPDWTSAARLDYTVRCAEILAGLLPDGADGSLSTVPLGGRMNPAAADFVEACESRLLQCARRLAQLRDATGRTIRLAIEPEPLCHLSSVPRDVVPFFRRLFERADAERSGDVAREFLGVCFDVCHQAVEFEDVAESIDLLVRDGVRINKVHITCAVELPDPAGNSEGRTALSEFVEPRYLHQTYARFADGSVRSRLDLEQADLERNPPDEFLRAEAWRVHFHVPVDADRLGPLHTTRPDLVRALERIARIDQTPHLEVETYTWPVMPGEADVSSGDELLVTRIARELESTLTTLADIRSGHNPAAT